MQDPQSVVKTCTFVTLGSTVGGTLVTGTNLPGGKGRLIVGGFLAMLGCSIVAEMDGELGAGLAIAIAGTAFIRYGLPALSKSSNAQQITHAPGVAGATPNHPISQAQSNAQTLAAIKKQLKAKGITVGT